MGLLFVNEIESHSPQSISQKMIDDAEKTVNMGWIDKESCPALFLKDIVDWQIQNPKGKPIEEVRKISDQIE